VYFTPPTLYFETSFDLITHSLLMLASDAGFVATAAMAPEGEDEFEGNSDDRSRHRAVAISSIGVATAGYVMMLFWK